MAEEAVMYLVELFSHFFLGTSAPRRSAGAASGATVLDIWSATQDQQGYLPPMEERYSGMSFNETNNFRELDRATGHRRS